MSGLIAKDVSVTIGGKTLLHSTSLAFEGGGMTAVLGPNGAGKTTLLKALLGLIKHDGAVSYGTAKRDALSPRDRAIWCAYLPQNQRHAWPLSVDSVVRLGRYPHNDLDKTGVVDGLMHRLGLAERRGQSVLTLSGGEQMRVALARALAVEANFLLADEPLASLDPHFQFDILNTLHDVAREGAGVVVVMHDLAMAARYADRVIVLDKGCVVADGSPDEALVAERVSSVFDVRSQVVQIGRHDGKTINVALPDGLA